LHFRLNEAGPAESETVGMADTSPNLRPRQNENCCLRLAAGTVGRTDTALGAFYRRLSARIGKAKAITATARKIAVLFYNTLRHGMAYTDPGATYYEDRYRHRVLHNLQRRAKSLGFVLQPLEPNAAQAGVS
jgi:transposase